MTAERRVCPNYEFALPSSPDGFFLWEVLCIGSRLRFWRKVREC